MNGRKSNLYRLGHATVTASLILAVVSYGLLAADMIQKELQQN